MSDTTQEHRDRLIRVESKVEHLVAQETKHENELRDLVETSRNQSYSVNGLLRSMEKAEDFMSTVGKHDIRIQALEAQHFTIAPVVKDLAQKDDRKSFLTGKVMWAITTPSVALVIYTFFSFIQHSPK